VQFYSFAGLQVLLESIGFECVMQYNENRQRSRKNVEASTSTDACSVDDQEAGAVASRTATDAGVTATDGQVPVAPPGFCNRGE